MNLEVCYHQRHRGFVILGAKSSDYEIAKARCTKNKTPLTTHIQIIREVAEKLRLIQDRNLPTKLPKSALKTQHTQKNGQKRIFITCCVQKQYHWAVLGSCEGSFEGTSWTTFGHADNQFFFATQKILRTKRPRRLS